MHALVILRRVIPWRVVVAIALIVPLLVLGVPQFTSRADAQAGTTRGVDLVEGFNLVGWGVEQDVAVAVASAETVTNLFQFDAGTKTFDSFGVGSPAFLNSLATLGAGHGIWALSDGASAWEVADLPVADFLTIDLEAGFNLVAWFGPDATPIGEALGPLGASVVRAFGWVAAAQRFKTFDPARAFLSDFDTLARGEALWLDMTGAARWEQPSSVAPVTETLVPAAEGGVAVSADGRFSLAIPAGALGEDTVITIRRVGVGELPADGLFEDAGGVAFELGPDGLEFATPARATVTGLRDPGEGLIFPVLVNADGSLEGIDGVEVNTAQDGTTRAEIPINHFSVVVLRGATGEHVLTLDWSGVDLLVEGEFRVRLSLVSSEPVVSAKPGGWAYDEPLLKGDFGRIAVDATPLADPPIAVEPPMRLSRTLRSLEPENVTDRLAENHFRFSCIESSDPGGEYGVDASVRWSINFPAIPGERAAFTSRTVTTEYAFRNTVRECLGMDFGDAPDSYGTTLLNDGARHTIRDNGVRLGFDIDMERNGQPGGAALGDDVEGLDDEDGFEPVPGGFTRGATATGSLRGISEALEGSVAAGDFWVRGWLDRDCDGQFDNVRDLILLRRLSELGDGGLFSFLVEPTAGCEDGESTYLRLRVSSRDDLRPTGFAPDGEVEDYEVRIVDPPGLLDWFDSETGMVVDGPTPGDPIELIIIDEGVQDRLPLRVEGQTTDGMGSPATTVVDEAVATDPAQQCANANLCSGTMTIPLGLAGEFLSVGVFDRDGALVAVQLFRITAEGLERVN